MTGKRKAFFDSCHALSGNERLVKKFFGSFFQKRTACLTCLCTTILAFPALAQPAPNARPTGGQVVAGQASISQSTTTTTIDEASARAVVNWQGFDVGANQTVRFVQPSATATTLNRVLSAEPSQIAGHITANGQIVLQNQSGVVFAKGAQVDAASIVVSAPGITDQNFMAGKMAFDVPAKPNAQIVNNGRITVRQSGLAALVAPQVANNGVITAKLGHVVLAGAETQTVDLYGDGMVSINVTGQVTQAPVGADGKPVTALVTNSGIVAASGGTVELTARAVDGIVQTLVTAGGRIAANTAGGHTGKIVVSGIGGSVIVEGDVSAAGRTPNSTGGAIAVNATGGVTVAGGARISASGAAGGGTIAIGTTLARARGGPSVTSTHTASAATIAKGAVVSADATQSGNGGTVVLLSTQTTSAFGEFSARGGPQGGNGGHVELSGDTGFALGARVDVTAQSPRGASGSVLIDPRDLYISTTNPVSDGQAASDTTLTAGTPASSPTGLPGASTDAWVTPTAIDGLSGAVTLTAGRDLGVLSALDTAGSGITSLTLSAGRNLNVNAALTTGGNLALLAGNALDPAAPITAGGVLELHATGAVTQTAGSTLAAGSLTGSVGSLDLSNSGNNLASVGTLIAAGNVMLATSGPLSFTGELTTGGKLTIATPGAVTQTTGSTIHVAALTGSVGSLSLTNTTNGIGAIGPLTAIGTIAMANGGPLAINGPLTAGQIDIGAVGNITLATNLTLVGSGPVSASFVVLPGSKGTSTFVQTGTSTVTQSGSGTIILNVATTGAGNITFHDLEAPASQLFIDSSAATIAGKVNVGVLALEIGGGDGSAAFTNTAVGGMTDGQAATATAVIPAANPAYLVNGCTAGAGCAITPTNPTSPTNPTNPTNPISPTNPTIPTIPPVAIAPTPAPTPAPIITPPVATPEDVAAAAAVATNIAIATPVVTGVANAVGSIATGSVAGTEDWAASEATANAVGAEETDQTQTDQKGVPLVNPLGEMARTPLRKTSDPDLVVPNVSERDY